MCKPVTGPQFQHKQVTCHAPVKSCIKIIKVMTSPVSSQISQIYSTKLLYKHESSVGLLKCTQATCHYQQSIIKSQSQLFTVLTAKYVQCKIFVLSIGNYHPRNHLTHPLLESFTTYFKKILLFSTHFLRRLPIVKSDFLNHTVQNAGTFVLRNEIISLRCSMIRIGLAIIESNGFLFSP